MHILLYFCNFVTFIHIVAGKFDIIKKPPFYGGLKEYLLYMYWYV